MAQYRIKVTHGGIPVQGVEVIAGDVLYVAATGADGLAAEPTAGRPQPVRVPVELIGPDFVAGTVVTLRPDVETVIEV